MIPAFKFRGPNSFYFKRKRHKPDNLKAQLACRLTCMPGGGGRFSANGDGEAYHKTSDRFGVGWFRTRKIKAGQWAGPWTRERTIDI